MSIFRNLNLLILILCLGLAGCQGESDVESHPIPDIPPGGKASLGDEVTPVPLDPRQSKQ